MQADALAHADGKPQGIPASAIVSSWQIRKGE